jgi:hypothetical protein
LDGLSFDSIDEAKANWLERDLKEGVVLEVVKAMNVDKAPGHDCYSMAFFQVCWVALKEDTMKVFHDFNVRGKFERSLNVTFIILIPKIPGDVDSKNFRPISLVGGIYKIIAKILANRLKIVRDSSKVIFRHDLWCGDMAHKEAFQDLYGITYANDASVAAHFELSVCRTKVPLREKFFAWSAALGKILTMDNFMKQHVIVVDMCYMCKSN